MKITKSKAFHLALLFSALIAVVVALFAFAFVFVLNSNVRKSRKDELLHSLQIVRTSMQRSFHPGSEQLAYDISFCVYENDEAQRVLFTNDPFVKILPQTNSKVRIYFEKNYYFDGDLHILYCTQNFRVGTERYCAQVSASLDNDFQARLLRELLPTVFLLLLPLVLISFTLALFITTQTMRPVKRMAKTAQTLSVENLEQQFPLSGSGDEFDFLSQTFNELFERLASQFKREKQFTSDVSHELKTPLTVILGHVNLIRRWGKDDPEQMAKSLERIASEVKSMQAITENLLKLSRLEAGTFEPTLERVNIRDVFERIRDDTFAWNPTATLTGENLDVSILCDREFLYEMFTIIVSNSVKYSDGSPAIHFAVQQEAGSTRIAISDNGWGITADALPHVLERFYRGDESHNRKKGGSGLGLAIVKSIMDVHEGKVSLESDGKTGTTVILEFADAQVAADG